MAIAVLQLMLLPEAAKWAARTAIVAAAVGAQKAAGTVHPPACGIAFVWVTSGQVSVWVARAVVFMVRHSTLPVILSPNPRSLALAPSQGDPRKGAGPLIGCAILIMVKQAIEALESFSGKTKRA